MSRYHFLYLFLCLSVALPAHADTIVTKRLKAMKRFVPLKKLTVGPDDQYRAAVDPTGSWLVFTHKADLVAHLQVQELKTGEVRDLLPLSADSQEAVFSPEGKIAFTYYRFNARGDICFVPRLSQPFKAFSENDIQCLKRPADKNATERTNPFWKSNDEIGFVERDIRSQSLKVVTQSLSGAEQNVLAEGNVWSPFMVPNGHYLVFNELNGERDETRRAPQDLSGKLTRDVVSRGFLIKDLSTGKTRKVHFSLPGLSGFPILSEDESDLYFSQYFNDTNNDHIIDGSDNAVIFRIPIKAVLSLPEDVEIFPEQLTSVESSCSFPRPFQSSLFVTCAFEGSLDIYQIPKSGIVPQDWDETLLTNALATSRTYQDRILILNALKFRTPLNSRSVDERLMINHLLSDDTLAAQFFLDRLAKQAPAPDKSYYEVLRIYLEARAKKNVQTPGEITREFQVAIAKSEAQLNKITGEARLKKIVQGIFKSFLDQTSKTVAALKSIRFDGKIRPMEQYLYFTLAQELYRLNPKQSLKNYLEAFQQMMKAPELSEEAQIYYAFTLLRFLRTTEPSLAARIDQIKKLDQNLPASPSTLLKSEAIALRLIEAPDEKAKLVVYRELDQLMSATRSNYFLRKALYIRAIVNFSESAQFNYLSFVASNWLRYTAADDTEFAYARAVFSDAALDQAYDSLGKKNLNFARDYFFQSLSLTDDLESHEGYIKAMVAQNQRKELDVRYQNLKSHEFIDDNMKFVEALLTLIDQADKAEKDPSFTGHLDQAIAKLNSMEQDRDSAVRHLLLGYCYLEKLLRQSSGFDFDKKLFENAHQDLMLAYDLGRDNDRIKAAALVDLGILHARVQNHGLATKFLLLRKKLEFENDDERLKTSWLLANALFHSHQADAAAIELSEIKTQLPIPVLERKAFYEMAAGKFKEAESSYEKLLKPEQITDETNLAKAYLDYGYALFKNKKLTEAKAALERALGKIRKLSKLKAGKDRLVDFEPKRIELVAEGLLAQASEGSEREKLLESRGKHLAEAGKLIDDVQPKIIQNKLQLAEAVNAHSPEKAGELMKDALKLAVEYADQNQYLGNAIFRTTVDYLVHGILQPDLYSKESPVLIDKIVAKAIAAYDAQKNHPPLLDFQKAKLQLLRLSFARKVYGKNEGPSANDVLSANEALKTTMPAQWSELEQLAALAR